MGKGGQKVETSRYEIIKYWDVMYSMMAIVNTAVWYTFKYTLKVNPKILITKGKKIFVYLYKMTDVY